MSFSRVGNLGNFTLGDDVPTHVQAGLNVLKQAYNYAQDLKRDVWDFAVEIRRLRASGLINNDLRWLIWKGYVEHGREITKPGDAAREFRRDEGLIFAKRTCFVLTDQGAQVVGMTSNNMRFDHRSNGSHFRSNGRFAGEASAREQEIQVPSWDRDRHQLRLDGRLIKEFKLNSPNQEAILMAFEEEGWPPRIDDPLIPHPETESKERLRNTIKSLNRKQVHRLIRFMGDGTGEAVRWELIPEKPE